MADLTMHTPVAASRPDGRVALRRLSVVALLRACAPNIAAQVGSISGTVAGSVNGVGLPGVQVRFANLQNRTVVGGA